MSFADALVGLAKGVARHGRIERFCSEIGWTIDGRDGNRITLDFNDPLTNGRPLYVSGGDKPVIEFSAFSMCILEASEIPEEVFAYLLTQNTNLVMGAWQMSFNDEKKVFFNLSYCALGDGLTAPIFKFICQKMIEEAGQFDRRMHKAGLLRI